jgi:hypothetical protein
VILDGNIMTLEDYWSLRHLTFCQQYQHRSCTNFGVWITEASCSAGWNFIRCYLYFGKNYNFN